MQTALLTVAWHLLGVFLIARLGVRFPAPLTLSSGVLFGAGAFSLAVVALLTLGVPYTPVSVALLVLVGMVLLWIATRGRARRVPIGGLILSTLLVAAIGWLGQWLNIAPMTADSSGQVLMGRSLALFGGFDPGLAGWPSRDFGWFANYSALEPILQSTAPFLGLPFHAGVTPTLFVALMATLAVAIVLVLWDWVGLRFACLAGVAAVGLCASTFMFAAQAVYLHNALLVAIYLFLYVLCVWYWRHTDDAAFLYLAAFSLLVYGVARLEGWIYAVFLLLPLLADERMTSRLRTQCVAIFALPLAAWYARLYTLTSDYAYMLTPHRALIMMAALAVFPVLTWWFGRRRSEPPFAIAAAASLYGIAACLAAAFVLRPGHMSESVASVVQNFLSQGAWQNSWYVLIPLAIGVAGLPVLPCQALWTRGPLAVFLFVVFLSAGREPYRLGWSDSANRLFVQFVPLVAMYVCLRIGYAVHRGRLGEWRAGAYRWRGALGPLVAVGLACFAGARPVNVARVSQIHVAPDTAPGFGLRVPLHLRAGFASAVERCPSEVLFGWPEPIRADWLDVVDHDPARGLRDFAWYTSEDGRDWRLLFDSRIGGACRRWANEPARYAIRLPDAPIRYVRLAARHAAGENRLLMERIRIWSSLARDEQGEPGTIAAWTRDDHVLASAARWLKLGEVDWAEGALVTHAGDGVVLVPPEVMTRRREGDPPPPPRMLADVPADVPLDVVLDLAWSVHADRVEVALDPLGACRVAVSPDGESWTPATAEGGGEPDGAVRFALDSDAPFRFVRVQAEPRSEPGVLRKVRVLLPVGPALHAAGARADVLGVPVDLAAGARALEAPECAPGYEFDVALRGVVDDRFVSAVEPCPSTVVVDLGYPCEADMLELEEHALVWAFEDFAIHVSPDRRTWRTVFDSRDADATPVYQINETTFGFDLRQSGAFRYIRLTVRAAREQNRIVMSRIAVWSTAPTDYRSTRAEMTVARPAEYRERLRTAEPEGGRVDWAVGATPLVAPLWEKGHDFCDAVDGRDFEGEFALAAAPGPTEVVIDLGWSVTGDAIEFVAGPKIDPAALHWSVSTDREHWTALSASDIDADLPADRLNLDPAAPLRYLRLQYDTGADGPPLELHRVSMLAAGE